MPASSATDGAGPTRRRTETISGPEIFPLGGLPHPQSVGGLHLPQDFLPLNASIASLSPAPRGPPAPGSRPAAPSFYTVLRLAPGGLRSGRPPLQPRMQLEERGFQRGDFSLWLRPARRADAGEYRAIVSLRDRAAVRSRDHALSCRLHLRVGQASSRWGQDKGRRARRRPPGSPPPRGRKGWAEAVLLTMLPRPAREPPEG